MSHGDAGAPCVIEAEGIRTRLGGVWVHDGIGFKVRRGELVALIGGSGSGKTVLLNELIGLMRPTAGRARLLGVDVGVADHPTLNKLRQRFGVLFQDGALFSSLTVAENVAAPLREHTRLPRHLVQQLVEFRLSLAGLPLAALNKLPAELSGGMRKRAALARALALEPEILFLDEPTSGLDPIAARAFDQTVRTLCDSFGLTVYMNTHDLDTLWGVVDRVIVLSGGKVIADGPVAEVAKVAEPWIQSYFSAHVPHRGG
ncbi:phospholipid/cholesterol/gamma-HCH transport system ATP-binding protein [Sulfuritortus calidifontis]|uniref:Phospholipid/cholesterol/gamma-HCH transport system ATP-binding protein n=1 Tax=Sulfuritortus calidifontis TaxID=1914471 RepID=A0A4R3JR57_9PROT|nr:ATP-binding cassette domain-containing protein [Sulfuritortus calidifontis]TCS69476.1 phospholipid/cholesterol/gamma-HCH transport system ATP-binding protein [Sulfuritortus calidifontis]